MVNGVLGVTALEEVLGHNTRLIELEVAIGVNADTYWLLVKEDLELIVGKILLLDHADILEGNTGLVVEALVMVSSILVGIVIIVHDSLLSGVFVSFVHPASIATCITHVAIKKLLHGEARNVLEFARNVSKSLKGTNCGESPA